MAVAERSDTELFDIASLVAKKNSGLSNIVERIELVFNSLAARFEAPLAVQEVLPQASS
jgi:hypothetical protein